MSTRPEYIQLEPGDDANVVRDRLSFIRGKRVLIIWPENGTALTRKLDLILVQREARRRAVQFALVTHDAEVIRNAQELGISTFETIGASDSNRWKRGRTRIFIQRHHKPQSTPEPEDLMPVASRVRGRKLPANSIQTIVVRMAIFLSVLLIIGTTAFLVIPTAEVRIALAEDILTVETSITIDPALREVDVARNMVPATILRANVQSTNALNTTGVEEGGREVAIGIVTFTNQTQRRITIPADTLVSTSAGTPILFRTIIEATLPGGVGQRIEVGIEALPESAGDIGNVGAGLINTVIGPLENDITVRNLTPTTGGMTRQFSTITEADRERLLAIARGQLQALAYDEMRTSLIESQVIVIETIRIVEERNDWTVFSHNIGDTSEILSLDMRAVVEAVAIDDRFARQLVLTQLSAQKPRGLVLLPETFEFTRGPIIEIGEDDRVVFTATGRASITSQLNIIDLQERLAGQTIDEASAIIAQRVRLVPGTTPRIIISPAWFTQMPFLPVRISISSELPTS